MGVNSLPKTVTRQRRGCDLNPGPSAPESSTLTTWLPSHTEKGLVLAVRIISLRTESVLRLGFGTGEGSAMTFRGGRCLGANALHSATGGVCVFYRFQRQADWRRRTLLSDSPQWIARQRALRFRDVHV